eukprot:g13648.t1
MKRILPNLNDWEWMTMYAQAGERWSWEELGRESECRKAVGADLLPSLDRVKKAAEAELFFPDLQGTKDPKMLEVEKNITELKQKIAEVLNEETATEAAANDRNLDPGLSLPHGGQEGAGGASWFFERSATWSTFFAALFEFQFMDWLHRRCEHDDEVRNKGPLAEALENGLSSQKQKEELESLRGIMCVCTGVGVRPEPPGAFVNCSNHVRPLAVADPYETNEVHFMQHLPLPRVLHANSAEHHRTLRRAVQSRRKELLRRVVDVVRRTWAEFVEVENSGGRPGPRENENKVEHRDRDQTKPMSGFENEKPIVPLGSPPGAAPGVVPVPSIPVDHAGAVLRPLLPEMPATLPPAIFDKVEQHQQPRVVIIFLQQKQFSDQNENHHVSRRRHGIAQHLLVASRLLLDCCRIDEEQEIVLKMQQATEMGVKIDDILLRAYPNYATRDIAAERGQRAKRRAEKANELGKNKHKAEEQGRMLDAPQQSVGRHQQGEADDQAPSRLYEGKPFGAFSHQVAHDNLRLYYVA